MIRVGGVLLLALAVLFPSERAGAADLEHGERLAKVWCANCHVVSRAPPARAQPGPPTFPALARSAIPADRLRTFLTKPHEAMPDLSLTRAEIADLVAYIESLR